MSHFVTAVVLPPGTEKDEESVQRAAKKLLAPFDENLEVEPYETDCWCVGRVAASFARDRVRDEHPEIATEREELRTQLRELSAKTASLLKPVMGENFWLFGSVGAETEEAIEAYEQKMQEVGLNTDADLVALLEEQKEREKALARTWFALFEREGELTKKYASEHPLYEKPDPNCGRKRVGWDQGGSYEPDAPYAEPPEFWEDEEEYCQGSGKVMSTRNPKAQWDWWVVGGRWNGFFTIGDPVPYDPAKDPVNWEQCVICGGSGKRWWKTVTRAEHPEAFEGPLASIAVDEKTQTRQIHADPGEEGAEEIDCNECSREPTPVGVAVKWPSQQVSVGNFTTVGAWREKLDREVKGIVPFAVLTPDGEWHERGGMGWWGMVSDEKDRDAWSKIVREQVAKLDGDLLVVACDLHI